MSQFFIYCDGGSLNNPGPSASSYLIYQDNKLLFSHSQSIGVATNNIAEYTAFVLALEKIRDHLGSPTNTKDVTITVFSDSRLLVNQVNGLFKVKNTALKEFILKIRILEQEIGVKIIYKNIPREKNSLADSLVKKILIRF